MTLSSDYRGRFAPSPTGPLHLGSLVAALASYLDARATGGAWLVRMEDLDRPRTVPGAADRILWQLEAHGLHWDESVLWQSSRDPAYFDALATLQAQGLVYPCGCSRAEIKASSVDSIYPGTCADGLKPGREPRALRLRTAGRVEFSDRLCGPYAQDLEQTCGDFVIRRADTLFAYQLAAVVDDGFQRITQVVRGADLLDSTPRQIYLQRALGLTTPDYLHLPLVLDNAGRKLAKRSGAQALLGAQAEDNLIAALGFLGQPPPQELAGAPVSELLVWAEANWSLGPLLQMSQG
ncbi:MAG: tRNA glutamyl-Q(34) synthetase GluQRS [Gammaproteobacteria bacterium]|nr:tRNA glutamyl-Q(34) synthetase GluQRS [Gammaproteobacteria bacterium]